MDDDVILFVGLAAGLRPVMAPVSANSGTIDPAAVPDATWSSLCGVLTTNLYGLPDRVAELWAPPPSACSSRRATANRRLNRPPGAPATDPAASRGPP